MKNPVKPKFRHFIKQLRNQSDVTVRELAEAISKSPGYVTQLEKGQIKTITFQTAMAILNYLNDKSHLLASESLQKEKADEVLANFLIDNLEIYPPRYFEKLVENQEREEQERIKDFERISGKLDKLESIILESIMTASRQEYILDFALQLSLVAGFIHPREENQLKQDLREILKKYRREE